MYQAASARRLQWGWNICSLAASWQPSGTRFSLHTGLKIACAVRPKANLPIASPNQYVVQVTHSFQVGVRFAQGENQSALLSRHHIRFLPSDLLLELLCFFQVQRYSQIPPQ